MQTLNIHFAYQFFGTGDYKMDRLNKTAKLTLYTISIISLSSISSTYICEQVQ